MSNSSPGGLNDTGWVINKSNKRRNSVVKIVNSNSGHENKLMKVSNLNNEPFNSSDGKFNGVENEGSYSMETEDLNDRVTQNPNQNDHDYSRLSNSDSTSNISVQDGPTSNKFYDKCDEEPFIVYIESGSNEQAANIGNMRPLTIGKKLFNGNFEGILEVKSSNKNRVVCNFKSAGAANMFVKSSFGPDNNFNVFIPSFQLERTGLIRFIDTSLTEEEILENLHLSNNQLSVVSVKRLTKTVTDDEGKKVYKPLPLVSIKFKGKRLPDYVYMFFNRFPVEPFVSNPVLCYKCIRFGHTSKNCKSSPRCSTCSGPHNSTACSQSENPLCLFCQGPHSALDRSCPEWDVQRKLKEVMAYRNISYMDAKKFLFPESNKSLQYNTTLFANYDKSFPTLQNTNCNQLKEKISIPPQSRIGKQPGVNTKMHKNVTTIKYSHRPQVGISAQQYTHKYYKNLQPTTVTPSRPVYKDRNNLTVGTQHSSSDQIINVLSLFQQNKLSIENLINELQPLMNVDLSSLLTRTSTDCVSDSSF